MKAKMYLHGCKEDNYCLAEEVGLPEEIHKEFSYALYEVEFDVDINESTGDCTILKVNGRKLEPKPNTPPDK